MSFYYWNTTFTLDSVEGDVLRNNDVYGTSPADYTVIPVVSIRNRVFEKMNPASIPAFAADIYARVRQINESRRLQNQEIQFDCNWAPQTRENYFAFLRDYHRISVESISSAIRMFQLRYAERVGVPPVDYGILFYFNLEETDTGNERSIYERAAAHHYTPSLRSYPLTLDVAIPLFAAARDVRDGEDLFEIIADINRHSNHHIRNLIFFDLNRENLKRYDRNVFREALARFN